MQPKLFIDLKALAHNYNLLKKVSKGNQCGAVVKNNAYGLGAIPVVKKLLQQDCETFFVAHTHEGIEIRNITTAKIMVFNGPHPDNIGDFPKYNLIPVINSIEQLRLWQEHFPQGELVLHIDTGLNRSGLREDDIQAIGIDTLSKLNITVIMSHLACADEAYHFMNEYQFNKFSQLSQFLPKAQLSLCASDGVFLKDSKQFNLARVGAAMYGINTQPYRPNQMSSVVTITAPVIQIAKVPAGQYIGYSATHKTIKDIKIAVLSIGYGDGLPRSLSSKGRVWFRINDQDYCAPMLGRISMDMTVCDITHIPDVKVWDEAGIITSYYTVDDMGRDADTIGYEIISRLGTRFDRKYL